MTDTTQGFRNVLPENLQQNARLLEVESTAQLATKIHELLCRWDHTEGCSWFYETNNGVTNWKAYAHSQYLTKTNKMLELTDVDTALEVINALLECR